MGNRALLDLSGVGLSPEVIAAADEIEQRGSAVVHVAEDGRVIGLVELAERMRGDVVPTLESLTTGGTEVVILTGDTAVAGDRWSQTLGVPVVSALTPAGKTEAIAALNQPVAMVGDGINDAPSLAGAEVGISVSDAADVARSAADVVVLSDDLRAVPWLIGLSKRAMRKVRQNLTWAFTYNVIGVVLAAAGLLPPVVAAGLMVLSSVVVTTNASGLRRYPAVGDDWQAGE